MNGGAHEALSNRHPASNGEAGRRFVSTDFVRHSDWLFAFLVAHSGRCYLLAAPGEEMVPLKEPMVVPVPVAGSINATRSTVKSPVAPANRPVPPVIFALSTAARTPGTPGIGLTSPVKLADSVSPLAATKL